MTTRTAHSPKRSRKASVTLDPTAASELLRALPNAAKPEVADWPASREEWAEAARLEAEAEAELADAESLDDPVRMYLREIGRVDLLNARQEKTLARKAEGWKELQNLEDPHPRNHRSQRHNRRYCPQPPQQAHNTP